MADEQRKRIRGATAFNEMAILRTQGREGYHLVGFGIGRLDLEKSDLAWEHLRLTLPSKQTLALLEKDGWTIVGTWVVFTYLKRPESG